MTAEQFLAITSPLPEAMFLVDGNGQLLAVNVAADRMLGVSGREILGQSVAEMTADSAEKVSAFLRTCGRSNSLTPGSLTWHLPGRPACPCSCHGAAVRPWTNEVPCLIMLRCKPKSEENRFMLLNRQLVELQRMHSDLRKHKNRLEVQVQERTQELERSNRELEQFAYIASHDLQEPLRKILTFGGRLKTKCSDAISTQGLDYLERMQNAALRMQHLINDLLTYSRVTTNAKPFVPVDLGKVVQDAISDLEIRIEESGGRVEIGALPTIDADPLQMHQLFQNLVGNALKYHKNGQPPIVKIKGSFSGNNERADADTSGEHCQLTIEDNGIGFDQQYAERIFMVFQRLHGRSEYEGSGVGLSVCRKITERHGGSISANGTPGHGATFTISLPIRQVHAETAVLV